MKFHGRNGGFACAVRNHIMLMRCFLISFLILLIPTVVFLCIRNRYFYVFMIMPAFFLLLSFAVLLFRRYDERVFLSYQKKEHLFEVSNGRLYKDNNEIKRLSAVTVYRYRHFLYFETSRTMFTVRDTDYLEGGRDDFLAFARENGIRVVRGY